ncbi:MAG: RHS repeat-associated core domain-containing protein [bacterium]
MGYHLTTSLARPSARSPASPKTHVPGSRLQERGLRFYSTELSRWVSRDPIGERGGRNLYAFVAADPVMHVDTTGMYIWPVNPEGTFWPWFPWEPHMPGSGVPEAPEYEGWEVVSHMWDIAYFDGPLNDLPVRNGELCLEGEEGNAKKWYISVGSTHDFLHSVTEPVPDHRKIDFWMIRTYDIYEVYKAKCSCRCPRMSRGGSSLFRDCRWSVTKQDATERWLREKLWDRTIWERGRNYEI